MSGAKQQRLKRQLGMPYLLPSGNHEYEKKGRYKIAVKVIDIFGNDTTKVMEIKV